MAAALAAQPAPDVSDNSSRPALPSSVGSGCDTPETQPPDPRPIEDHVTDKGKGEPGSPKDATDTQSAIGHHDPSNEVEDMATLRTKCRRCFDRWNDDVLQEERAGGHLATRSLQASLHLALTEERISGLEKSLHELSAAVQDLPPDFSWEKGKMGNCCRYQPVLKRCLGPEFDMFLPHGRREAAPIEERRTWPALEVLSSQVGLRLTPGAMPPKDIGPERLRIRYQPLLWHLRKTTHESLPDDTGEDSGLVFLRPFKFFVKYAAAIRDSLPVLQDDLRKARGKPKTKGSTIDEEMMSKGEGICGGDRFLYEDLIRCLKLLIEFIDVDLAPVFDLRRKIADCALDEIEYADLWHLFQRGDYVLSDFKRTEILEVVNVAGGRDPLCRVWTDTTTPSAAVEGFAIDCISLAFNGQQLVPHLTKLRIPKFSGSKRISSLSVYPLRFAPDGDEVRAARLSHGATYIDLVTRPFQHMMLRGTTVDEPPQQLEAQVIVDTVLATNSVPEWRVPSKPIEEAELTVGDHRETRITNSCVHIHSETNGNGCCGSDRVFEDLFMDKLDLDRHVRSSGKLSPVKPESLGTEDRVLLANWVHGFVLRSRQWVKMRVVDLSPVEFVNDFDHLILPDDHKRTIRALVEIHENARTEDANTPARTSIGGALDLVKGKGTGLVILLHGEPGVGKTSTAECIADTTRRPLFPITCGDIGETPLEAERNLHSNFRMAQKWGCVLLLDEADVFLAKRTQMDVRQNAITSVFLRSLEYYGGILFLTTNRVGGIDPAFKSRVHMALLYQPLDLEATRKLYAVFINRTREEQKRAGVARFTIKRKEILRFAKQHYKQLKKLKGEGIHPWNGR